MIANPRVGMRARFIGKDDFHPPVREGKLGTIVADANLENGTNWGDGCCMWEIDGAVGWYVTALADLEEHKEVMPHDARRKSNGKESRDERSPGPGSVQVPD